MGRSTLYRAVVLGVRSLMLHRLRSMLTTLGVLFGTSSVIAMLAIGEGASAEAQDQIRALGSQNVILRSVKPREDPNQGSQRVRVASYGLTFEDLHRIEDAYPGIETIVPLRELSQEVRHLARVADPRVLATKPNYLEVTGRLLVSGRWLSELDERMAANVCVVGSEVARKLFPMESPLGQQIKIGGEYFTVVGILAPRVRLADDAAKAGEEITDELYLPLSTGVQRFGDMQVRMRAGSMDREQVDLHEIVVAVDVPENVRVVADAARAMLERYHKQGDFEVVVPLELLARAEETKRIFNIVLGSIAGISLLVGGIGIMNVMLATVTERTREIGIRRALGAKRHHIVTQFLVETVVLSVGGGAAGVVVGLAIPVAVEHFARMHTVITPAAPTLAFSISALIGVVFGLYPAWRAARMDPVDALRHE
ncbi:ABC transporter permease [Engelhardtia mirabilis]|uniref:Macrolide export ATP-binding/permease protein MacB n=1 Tax=Engelhardtia mirabilis TaxID=2528011 RepID=A0A518BP52_9BACT|nr:Macrolide export ATP-binding/permease protein MacB [Planctomycetes bacterium Pla133]QDV03084.1 Macrolide export ATP-binding/permease protein MacB [Planctomycetes bacterium Pla86]